MSATEVRIPYLTKIDFEFRLPDGERGRMSAMADPDQSYVEYMTVMEDTAFGPKIVQINLDATVVSDAIRMHIIEAGGDDAP